MEELILNDINNSIEITRKALSNIQLDIVKWEDKINTLLTNEINIYKNFLNNSRSEKTMEERS